MSPLAFKSSDGRVYVLDDGFAASSKDGGKSWVPKVVFPEAGKEDSPFRGVPAAEAETLAKAARNSLS